jgi:hypothetical protein
MGTMGRKTSEKAKESAYVRIARMSCICAVVIFHFFMDFI